MNDDKYEGDEIKVENISKNKNEKKNNFDVESEPPNENNENSDIKKMIWMILIYIY